jgi:L-seryl-tRNA(Ser) seleniumtransferase
MISEEPGVVKKRAQRFMRRTKSKIAGAGRLTLAPTISRVGGGALPEYGLDSWAVEVHPNGQSIVALERDFRALQIPVIGRIENDRLLLDFRTVIDAEVGELSRELSEYFNRSR